MTDVSGIPNMGFGGGGYLGGNAANGTPAMSSAQIMASLYGNYSPGQAQATLNNIYGPQGFGGQTAQYAAQGAAYGRATGGFGGYGAANADPFTSFGGAADQAWMRGGSQGPRPSSQGGGGGIGSDMRFGGQADVDWMRGGSQGPRPSSQGGGYIGGNQSAFSYNPASMGGGGGFGGPADVQWMRGGSQGPRPSSMNPYAGMILGPQANPSYFNPGTYAGDQGNYGIPYNGQSLPGDIGFSKQPSYPNLGYNPGMANSFANPGMSGGDFQNRFGMGFPNAGTIDQPGGALPPSGPFGMNPNPGS